MKYSIIFLSVIILLCNSCNRSKKGNSSIRDPNPDFEDSQLVTQSKAQLDESLWLIKNHRIGVIMTSSKIDSSILKISEYFEVSFDSIDLTDSGYGDGIEYFFNVNLHGNLMFRIHPDSSLQRIQTIEVVSNAFSTDKGFKIGSHYGELRGLYQIISSSFNYNDGLFVYAKDFDGTFRLHTEELDTYQIDSIPKNIAVDRIIIY